MPARDSITPLFAPFDPSVIKWRAGATTKDKSKALGLAYVDARDVMERFDEAFGPAGWQDSYYVIDSAKSVVQCNITAVYEEEDAEGHLHYRSVTKTDVGYPNGTGDDEPFKSAYSDAFKRCAVKFGVGRDLYDTEAMWLPYDEGSRRITAFPQYVVGKGWVAPGQSPAPKPAAPAKPAVALASDAMRKKVFALASEAGLGHEQLKAMALALTGKDSSSGWTTKDVDALIATLEDGSMVQGA